MSVDTAGRLKLILESPLFGGKVIDTVTGSGPGLLSRKQPSEPSVDSKAAIVRWVS